MSNIVKPTNDKLNPMGTISLPCMEVPSFRFLLAQERRLLKNILIRTPFALGDCICAEPAIRYAQKNFEGCTISLTTPFPDLYRHIPNIKKIYNSAKGEKPNWYDYYVFECYHAAEALQSEFVHNFNMAIEDYICVSLFKGMIPVQDRNIVLKPSQLDLQSFPPQEVVIHAGKHWVSKSFPKKWWDQVIAELFELGITPTLIGARVDDGKRGYVEVNSEGCVDLRDKLTVMQSVAVLQRAKVVITNDSAPYHMACSSCGEFDYNADPYVGVFSTVRHFDYIGHWRPWGNFGNQWNHKIENLAKGQMWQDTDVTPARNGGKYDVCNYETLMSWLPQPEFVAAWAQQKLRRARESHLYVSNIPSNNTETLLGQSR